MLTVIGDVHGLIDNYLYIARHSDYSLQIGDLGFRRDYNRGLTYLARTRHRVIAGNHDDYEVVNLWPHFLGDFGQASLGGVDFFFIRGERSIDYESRTLGLDYFENEQLSYLQQLKCLELYETVKPEIVISHGCPESIIPDVASYKTYNGQVLTPSSTAKHFQALFDIHQPKMWIFGHYHNSRVIKKGRCTFRCLSELEVYEIE